MKFLSLFWVTLLSVILVILVIAVPVLVVVHLPPDYPIIRSIVIGVGAYAFFSLAWWSWQINYSYWQAPDAKSFVKRTFSRNEIEVDLVLGALSTIIAFIYAWHAGYL